MSEADFYAAKEGEFRGSRYPGFTGGSTTAQGNVQTVPVSANVSQASGQNLSPDQVEQRQLTSAQGEAGDASTGTGSIAGKPSAISNQSIPSGSQTLAGTIGGAVLPAAGNIMGSAIGSSLAGGATLAGSLGSGVSALGEAASNFGSNLASGNFSGLLGSSAGSASSSLAGSAGSVAPMSVMGSAGPMSVAGSSTSSAAGSAAGGAGSVGGSIGMGLGTFAAGLLSGQGLAKSAVSGSGSAVGAYLGSFAGPVGTVVGSFLGSMLGGLIGGKTAHAGGTAWLRADDVGHLTLGSSGGKHVDVGALVKYTQDSADAINKILDENNLRIDTAKYMKKQTSIGVGPYSTDENKSATDLWNWLTKNNMIVSKTPKNTATQVANTQSSSENDIQPSAIGSQLLAA